MKGEKLTPMIILVIRYYYLSIVEIIMRPLRGLPAADMNDLYDETML